MKESILRDIKKDSPSGRFATTQSSVRSNEMLDVSSHINKVERYLHNGRVHAHRLSCL